MYFPDILYHDIVIFRSVLTLWGTGNKDQREQDAVVAGKPKTLEQTTISASREKNAYEYAQEREGNKMKIPGRGDAGMQECGEER